MASSGSCMLRSVVVAYLVGQSSLSAAGSQPGMSGPRGQARGFPYCTPPTGSGKLHRMNIHQLIRELREPGTSKIVLLVADGLGGLPEEPGGKTELESA